MNKALLLVAGFLTIGIWSCKKDDSGPSCTSTSNFKYLKVGNWMSYDYSDLGSNDDSLRMEVQSQPSAGTYLTKLIGGGVSVQSTSDKRYTKECSDWLYVSAAGEPDLNTNKVFPANRTLNQSWAVNNNSSTYTVVGKDVSITVPAGTFTCDKLTYHSTGTINTDTIWFSNDIGYIKYDGLLFWYELRAKNF